MIELSLPMPPSQNHIWRFGKKSAFLAEKYKRWKEDAGWLARQQTKEKINVPYKLSIAAVRPDKRRRDIDNIIKPISDLLQSIGVVKNDCLCEMLSARWVTVGEGVTIRIEPAGVE